MNRLASTAALILLLSSSFTAFADTIYVPQDFRTIQPAIDSASAGDMVLVSKGRYRERVVLKPGVILKSAGEDTAGKIGLLRAETTIIDGETDSKADQAGVTMAEAAVLDGFTVTGVGDYDEQKWQRHHATQGNQQRYENIGASGVPGIAIVGIQCEVRNNIVHHIGYTGIAIQATQQNLCSPLIYGNVCYRNMGGGIGSMHKSTAVIQKNICFENFYAGIGHDNASPLVIENTCYKNIRAGIGISEGSCPIVRGNKCYGNRRAGIGSRTLATTRPVIEDNDCYDNQMAGIGTDDHAAPVIKNNRCFRNRLAGIGSQNHATPTILENECYENGTVGIGQESDAVTTLIRNRCHDNKAAGIGFSNCDHGQSTLIENQVIDNAKVALGIQAGWVITAVRNKLSRKGGMPPIVMIFENAQATLIDNTIEGCGVAGIRVAGKLSAIGNRFECPEPRKTGPPNNAVWALRGSTISMSGNTFQGWRKQIAQEPATDEKQNKPSGSPQ